MFKWYSRQLVSGPEVSEQILVCPRDVQECLWLFFGKLSANKIYSQGPKGAQPDNIIKTKSALCVTLE